MRVSPGFYGGILVASRCRANISFQVLMYSCVRVSTAAP